jgi:hypothetical protein
VTDSKYLGNERQARAPAFGLRAAVDGDEIVVWPQDTRGRGDPHVAILLGVDREGDRFKPAGKLDDLTEPVQGKDHAVILPKAEAYVRYVGDIEPEELVLRIPRSEWSAFTTSPLVLLLFLYDQTPGVGGPFIPAGFRTFGVEVFAENAAPAPLLRHEIEEYLGQALAEAAFTLSNFTVADLRRGLIEAPPGDQTDLGKPNGKSAGVTFALASCLYPSDMLDYMPDAEEASRGPADASLLALSDLVGAGGPSLLLLAGDQVYIDATAGLLDPKVSDDRVKLSYQRRGRSRGVLSIAGKLGLRVESMLDDHEIQDNWAPNDPVPDDPDILERAKKYYFEYQHKPAPSDRLYRSFVHNTLPFFLGDTRTERQPRTAEDWRTREIMSPEQRDCLEKWLEAHSTESPKFVLTPSALLPRHLAVAEDSACGLLSDSWDGYPASLHRLLAFLCEKQIQGVVFLSGDEHVGISVTARVEREDGSKATTFYSIHAPALHAPYPFANATPAEFAADDSFRFVVGNVSFVCRVRTEFPPPGDGFALVTWDPPAKELRLVFHGAAGPRNKPILMTF